MEGIKLWARNGEAVRRAIELGEIVHLDTASEELTDEFLLFAIESGLLKSWAEGFPDPRVKNEVSVEVILACSVAARFAGLYSMRKIGYVLRSARVLGALGYSVEVVQPGQGVSVRGTSDEKVLSGDVIRKLLVKMETEAKPMTPPEPLEEATVNVKVRARASRRAVKKAVDRHQAEARGRVVGQQLVAWYNQCVAPSMLAYADLGGGRRIHLLDSTEVEVALETGTYECSGVIKNDDGSYSRGYKLLTLRTLLDTAGILTGVAVAPIQHHDLTVSDPLLQDSPVLRAGDLLVEDRGFLDGARITWLKQHRHLDVIIPLRSDMIAFQEAVKLATRANRWQPHPTRSDQQIALVKRVEHVWDSCGVPVNACVIRFWNQKQKKLDHIVLVTTDLTLTAAWIVRHYQERPEIEQDYEQLKSGGWLLQKLSTTRYSEIVFYLLTILLSYSLYHLFANTTTGARFADKTRQALALEQLCTRRTHVIVYAGGFFELYETRHFLHLALGLSSAAQQRLRAWLQDHLDLFNQRE